MINLEIRDLQINFNQAEDPLTISTKSRGDNKCGSATQSGRSMIEMLGVLAIIGVLSVGGIAGYSKAMHKYRINKTIEQITLIAGNVRSFFAPQRNYSGLSNTVIRKAKLVPDEMWDGSLPTDYEVCAELLTYDWSVANARVLYTCNYEGCNYKSYLKTPVSIDEAMEACTKIMDHTSFSYMYFYLCFDVDSSSTYWQSKLNPSS